jgi:hypothetical protein
VTFAGWLSNEGALHARAQRAAWVCSGRAAEMGAAFSDLQVLRALLNNYLACGTLIWMPHVHSLEHTTTDTCTPSPFLYAEVKDWVNILYLVIDFTKSMIRYYIRMKKSYKWPSVGLRSHPHAIAVKPVVTRVVIQATNTVCELRMMGRLRLWSYMLQYVATVK